MTEAKTQKFSMFEYDFDSAKEEKYRQAFLALSKLAPGQDKTAETVSKECPEYKPYKQRQREVREQNRAAWIHHCEAMSRMHQRISEQWSARRAEYLRIGSDGIAPLGGGGE